MASIKLGNGINAIAGKLGGNVYKRGSAGQQMQSAPAHGRRTYTATQIKRQKAFQTCVTWLRDRVNDEVIRNWKYFASRHPATNKLGDTVYLTWYQMFIKMNIWRVFNDLDPKIDPPNE